MMRMRSCCVLLTAVGLIGFVGIRPLRSADVVAAVDGIPAVKVVDVAGLKAEVARHKGSIVLVDCWATWCVPCVKAFPETVRLSKAYRSQGLKVMSLSFDTLEDNQPPGKVQKFLNKQGAAFPNFISKLELSEDGAEAFGIPDGALPHFLLYGRDGKLLAHLGGTDDEPLTHEKVEEAVLGALKGK